MMLHNIHIKMELHKVVTMEQHEWPEGKMAYPREKNTTDRHHCLKYREILRPKSLKM